MSAQDNGGAAFPVIPPAHASGESLDGYPYHEAGMTLRDYFAAKAMEGELSAMRDHEGEVCGIALDASDDVLARLTNHYYRIANAMLAARSRT